MAPDEKQQQAEIPALPKGSEQQKSGTSHRPSLVVERAEGTDPERPHALVVVHPAKRK